MIDFSGKTDLQPLASVLVDLQAVSGEYGIETLLVGAAARDVRLTHQHGIRIPRETLDIDFAITVESWAQFEQLRARLLVGGAFTPVPGQSLHKLRHRAGKPLDIVPFGGVERPDRTILWPPAEAELFDCFGLKEALLGSDIILLPGQATAKLPAISALALLKITAWRDRQTAGRNDKDASDLLVYLRHYAACGNMDRITDDSTLIAVEEFDTDEAGARLLARDMVKRLDASGREKIHSLLEPECDADGNLKLARQSGIDPERARRLLASFVKGIED